MGKGPEFFPGWISSRGATNHSATRLGAAGRAGKGKIAPEQAEQGGEGAEKTRGCPSPGGAEPRGGSAVRTAGPGGCGPCAAPPERRSPHPALNTPNPGGTFPAWLVFFLLCFVLEAKAFESPSRTGIKDSFFKSY